MKDVQGESKSAVEAGRSAEAVLYLNLLNGSKIFCL